MSCQRYTARRSVYQICPNRDWLLINWPRRKARRREKGRNIHYWIPALVITYDPWRNATVFALFLDGQLIEAQFNCV